MPNFAGDFLKRMRMRGAPGQDVTGAGSMQAPMPMSPGLDQAYGGIPPGAAQNRGGISAPFSPGSAPPGAAMGGAPQIAMGGPSQQMGMGQAQPSFQNRPGVSANPFMLNQGMEQQAQAQGGQNELHPIVQQIMQRLGMMNMIRNRANQQMIDPSQM